MAFYRGKKVLDFIQAAYAKEHKNNHIADELNKLVKKDEDYAWGGNLEWTPQKVSQISIKHDIRRGSERRIFKRETTPVFQDIHIPAQPASNGHILVLVPLNKLNQIMEILK